MTDHKDQKREVVVGLERLRRGLSELMGRVVFGGERVIVYDYRTERGALIGPDDLARLRAIDAADTGKDRAA